MAVLVFVYYGINIHCRLLLRALSTLNAASRLGGKVSNLHKMVLVYFYHKDKVEHLIFCQDWPREVDTKSVVCYRLPYCEQVRCSEGANHFI